MPLKVIDQAQTYHRKDSVTVLVVEDHAVVRHALTESLRWHGYNVLTAANGRDAIKHISTSRVHVIVLDLMIPPPDGFEVLDIIQRHKQSWGGFPYSIVISCRDEEDDLERLERLGADEFAHKPFRVPVIAERIERFKRSLTFTDGGFTVEPAD